MNATYSSENATSNSGFCALAEKRRSAVAPIWNAVTKAVRTQVQTAPKRQRPRNARSTRSI